MLTTGRNIPMIGAVGPVMRWRLARAAHAPHRLSNTRCLSQKPLTRKNGCRMSLVKQKFVGWVLTVVLITPGMLIGQDLLGYATDVEPTAYYAATAPTVATVAATSSAADMPLPAIAQPGAAAPQDDYVLISPAQLKALEPWRIGDYKVVPYGALWADMIYATERTFPGAFTLFVPSPETQGEPAFTIDARRTRLGLNITGPDMWLFGGSKTGGQVEIDFMGSAVNDNQAGLMIRHLYWEAKNERWRMLVGQTWDVMSPLMPNTCSYSVGWDGGNIGFRRAQFRWDRYMDFSPTVFGVATVALAQNVVTDFSTVTTIERETPSWPVIEGRLGWKLGERGKDCLPVETGVSGHIGRTEFDFRGFAAPPLLLPPAEDAEFPTWSLNYDLKFPVTQKFGFQGELFTGANLSPFLGGVGQGVSLYWHTPIRSSGGWGELWYYWAPELHSHVGYGVDDPVNNDVVVGRSYNSFLFVNTMYDITKKFTMGLEVTNWRTFYVADQAQVGPVTPGDSWVFEWMCKYAF
jgi:hypothetical protein